MSGPRPETPAEHYAEAVALLNEAADFPPYAKAAIGLATRASAHALLALHRPPILVLPAGLEDVDPEELAAALRDAPILPGPDPMPAPAPAPTAKKTTARPRKAATTKETTE